MAADACGHPPKPHDLRGADDPVYASACRCHINLAGFVNTEGGETGEGDIKHMGLNGVGRHRDNGTPIAAKS